MSAQQKKFVAGVAVDSFKGSLTSIEAATCIEVGLKRAMPSACVRKIPVADGGEGTVQAIIEATGGRLITRRVSDPLGRPVRAAFGLDGEGRTAVIEMAAASGLALLKPSERNPMRTTTRGTGELILAALDRGVRKILIGIGGSATNDGGTGMARALGMRFLDARGRDLPEGGGALVRLAAIDTAGLDPRVAGLSVEVACDVDNPLAGPRGAARVYGPQKGATPAMIRTLDDGLRNLGHVIRRDLGVSILRTPGAGAAGGLGGGLMAFLGGTLRPGVDIVMEAVRLREKLRGCHLVITGEGRMDGQTLNGKTPSGVARVARELGIPVIAVAGCLGDDAHRVIDLGISAWLGAQKHDLDEAGIAAEGPALLTECAEQAGRLLAIGMNLRSRRFTIPAPPGNAHGTHQEEGAGHV